MKPILLITLCTLLIFRAQSTDASEYSSSDSYEPYEVREARFKEKLNQVEDSEWLTEIIFKDNDKVDPVRDDGLEKKEIPLDTSFFESSSDKITFSVNKVEQNKPKNLINKDEIFTQTLEGIKYSCSRRRMAARNKGEEYECREFGRLHDSSINRELENSTFVSDMYAPGPILTIYQAYMNHHHLALSPSDFLILIGQGLATHINLNPEKFRKLFVDHEGKEKIAIDRTHWNFCAQNDWTDVFPEFATEIQKRIKNDLYDIVVDDLGTATQTTKIVSELNLMDSMQNYFEYVVLMGCGFPKITLKGTVEDWQHFKEKVYKLKKLNENNALSLNWWLSNLLPIVDKITEAGIDRKIDHLFWANMYKDTENYGTLVQGWINAFLPFTYSETMGFRRNYLFRKGFNSNYIYSNGINMQDYTDGFTKVPFITKDMSTGISHSMNFYSGILGTRFVEENNWVEPAYFWTVFDIENWCSARYDDF